MLSSQFIAAAGLSVVVAHNGIARAEPPLTREETTSDESPSAEEATSPTPEPGVQRPASPAGPATDTRAPDSPTADAAASSADAQNGATPTAHAPAPTRDTGYARIRYEDSRIVWGTTYMGPPTGVMMAAGTNPMLGSGEELSWVEFYRMTGSRDDVEFYKTRRRTRMALLGVGVGLMVSGAVTAGTSSYFLPEGSSRYAAGLGVGIGVAAVGTIMFVTQFFIKNHPADERQRAAMATRYNEALARRLGLR